MDQKLEQISKFISEIKDVKIVTPLHSVYALIKGDITITVDDNTLSFEVVIAPHYPFQFHDSETIRFINTELVKYNHVNRDGSVCIHTQHSPDIGTKILFDFAALQKWIKKYYIGHQVDSHYEHIITSTREYKGDNFCFLFTEIDHFFKKGDFGLLKYSYLSSGNHKLKKIHTYLIRSFEVDKNDISCKWSSYYKKSKEGIGLYVFIEKPPVVNSRFTIENWQDLEPYVDQRFMQFLYNMGKNSSKKETPVPTPLFIGYKIPDGEIHWQCAAIDNRELPNHGIKVPGTTLYEGVFKNELINWVQTQNCSYKYFFGRGTLNKKLLNSKILIIGIGAIGSNVATTLTRGGCRFISLADYDIKEPENICRSEYAFFNGLDDKVNDLARHLAEISPFVEIEKFNLLTDQIKEVITLKKFNAPIKQKLDEFDYIFDCSADNDLAFIIDELTLESQVINLSISNQAKELVCVTNPKLYKWLVDIYHQLGNSGNDEDLYNPLGCWSPTFKASYNDIVLMVQFAIKIINLSIEKNDEIRNFYLQIENNEIMNIKLHQF